MLLQFANNSMVFYLVSLSLTDFEQLCSENDSNPAIKYQHSREYYIIYIF